MSKRQTDNIQKAKIHIAIADLKLSDDVYRDILWTQFKAESCKDLTYNQGQKLLAHFEHTLGWKPRKTWSGKSKTNNVVKFPSGGKRKGNPARRRKKEGDDNTVEFITRKQSGFIKRLAFGILKWDEKRLKGFCVKRAIGKEKPANKDEAGKVISALQKVIKGGYGEDRFQEK